MWLHSMTWPTTISYDRQTAGKRCLQFCSLPVSDSPSGLEVLNPVPSTTRITPVSILLNDLLRSD